MPTAPKVTHVQTLTVDTRPPSQEISTTAPAGDFVTRVHPGNRKERRKERSAKQHRNRASDENVKQRHIYNHFLGY